MVIAHYKSSRKIHFGVYMYTSEYPAVPLSLGPMIVSKRTIILFCNEVNREVSIVLSFNTKLNLIDYPIIDI